MLRLVFSRRWSDRVLPVSAPPVYVPDARPGTFDHGSTDCQTHGDNVGGFRLHKAGGPLYCVACALDPRPLTLGHVFERGAAQQDAARQALGDYDGWRT